VSQEASESAYSATGNCYNLLNPGQSYVSLDYTCEWKKPSYKDAQCSHLVLRPVHLFLKSSCMCDLANAPWSCGSHRFCSCNCYF
jgi:hypothetical protein